MLKILFSFCSLLLSINAFAAFKQISTTTYTDLPAWTGPGDIDARIEHLRAMFNGDFPPTTLGLFDLDSEEEYTVLAKGTVIPTVADLRRHGLRIFHATAILWNVHQSQDGTIGVSNIAIVIRGISLTTGRLYEDTLFLGVEVPKDPVLNNRALHDHAEMLRLIILGEMNRSRTRRDRLNNIVRESTHNPRLESLLLAAVPIEETAGNILVNTPDVITTLSNSLALREREYRDAHRAHAARAPRSGDAFLAGPGFGFLPPTVPATAPEAVHEEAEAPSLMMTLSQTVGRSLVRTRSAVYSAGAFAAGGIRSCLGRCFRAKAHHPHSN